MDETTLLSLNNEELYRVFIAKIRDLTNNELITQTDIQHVKHGKKLHFSLNKYHRYKHSREFGIFKEKPKSNQINCDTQGTVNLDDFHDELEYRNGIMLNALLDYYAQDDDIITRDDGNLQNN